MLRKLLIIFLALPLTLWALPQDRPLYLTPEKSAKIIGAIKDAEKMVLLEKEGDWAKVVDGETGMVGWLRSDNLPVKPS